MVAVSFIEDGFAAWCKNHFGLLLRAPAFDSDETFYERVLPYGMPGTCAPPRLHGFGVGALTTADPGKELYHQQAQSIRHRAPPCSEIRLDRDRP